jgi:hypothetical protein
MTRRPLLIRSVQVLAVGSAYAMWRLTQYLLEASRGSITGFTDHSHELFAGINAYLNAHSTLADVILAVSSFEVDLAGASLVVFFFTRRESRPLLTLWLILILRQICQATISVPPPEGMIWHFPGFPSLIVTYGTSTDFFFSGHMALATAVASELTAQRAPRWKQTMAWSIAAVQAFVILSMRFHYFTDVAAGCFAAVVATRLAEGLSHWIDERFAPWTVRSADRYRYQPVPGAIGEEQA